MQCVLGSTKGLPLFDSPQLRVVTLIQSSLQGGLRVYLQFIIGCCCTATMAVLMIAVPTPIKCSNEELQRISDDLEYRISSTEQLLVVLDESNKAIGYWFVKNCSDLTERATDVQQQAWSSKQAKKSFK
jgi:hypothetical protein